MDATARGDTAAAQRSHDQAEAFRRRYGGYSGGADGSDYIKDGTYFTYDDPYADALGQLADSILSYESFENPYRHLSRSQFIILFCFRKFSRQLPLRKKIRIFQQTSTMVNHVYPHRPFYGKGIAHSHHDTVNRPVFCPGTIETYPCTHRGIVMTDFFHS